MAVDSIRSRLDFNHSALKQLEERESALLLAEERASAALQSAQDALDAVRAELQDIRGRSAGVASTISELRGYLSARLLRSFPTELLYKIFVDAVPDADAWDGWMSPWNLPQPRTDVMPFTLAAVCRRWRCEAVRMARLWSFIVVPSPLDRSQFASDYLTLMLQRSQDAPLDIVLDWKSQLFLLFAIPRRVLPTPVCEDVFDQLGHVTQRLRRMYCTLPDDCEATPAFVELLQYPMPQLRHLTVVASAIAWRRGGRLTDDFLGRCLPHCPRLVKLHTDIAHVLRTDSHWALTHLVLNHISLSGEAVWKVLRDCAAALAHLDIGLIQDHSENPSAPPFTLALPALRTLVTRSRSDKLLGAWRSAFQAPHLEALEVQDGKGGFSGKVVAHFAETLVSLFYCTYITLADEDAAQLSVLRKLRCVSLFEPCADFFVHLTEHNAWPQLENLTLILGDTEEEDHRALVQFARTRKESAEMASLQRIQFTDHSGPGWLEDTLALYVTQVGF